MIIIFFIDFFGLITILAIALGLGYLLITNIVNILIGIIFAVIVLAILFGLLKVLNYFFPKVGWLLWYAAIIMLLISLLGGTLMAYHSYYVYTATQDITIAEFEKSGSYEFIEDEEEYALYEDYVSSFFTIPAGTEFQTVSLEFKFEYNPFRNSYPPEHFASFEYNGKDLEIPYKVLKLVGERPLFGDVEYK